jgi:hypothetical protein
MNDIRNAPAGTPQAPSNAPVRNGTSHSLRGPAPDTGLGAQDSAALEWLTGEPQMAQHTSAIVRIRHYYDVGDQAVFVFPTGAIQTDVTNIKPPAWNAPPNTRPTAHSRG